MSADLDAIERRLNDSEPSDVDRNDFREVIAEVKRLRAMIASTKGDVGYYRNCPWCSKSDRGDREKHEEACPAFNPDGTVK